jgi:rubrerythrin
MKNEREWSVEAYNSKGERIIIYVCLECDAQWTSKNKIKRCPNCTLVWDE